LFCSKVRVGYNESDTTRNLAHMPLDLTDNLSGLIPTLRLVFEFDHLHLYPACWRTTARPWRVGGLSRLLGGGTAGPDLIRGPGQA
jgi:hypothetical protein